MPAGLSEVLAALGTKRLESILPDVVANAYSPQAHVREGCLSLFIYLPQNFKESLTPHLQQLVPPILKGARRPSLSECPRAPTLTSPDPSFSNAVC